MIVKTKLGVLVSGTLAREPEVKSLGGKDVLILNVKVQSEKDQAGHWKSLFVDVQCWNGIAPRDGMYQKGDFLAAFGREVKRREYPEGSGKVFLQPVGRRRPARRPGHPALDAAGGGHDPGCIHSGPACPGRDRRSHTV